MEVMWPLGTVHAMPNGPTHPAWEPDLTVEGENGSFVTVELEQRNDPIPVHFSAVLQAFLNPNEWLRVKVVHTIGTCTAKPKVAGPGPSGCGGHRYTGPVIELFRLSKPHGDIVIRMEIEPDPGDAEFLLADLVSAVVIPRQ